MTRPELLAEKKRTEIYLSDMRLNTPSVILDNSSDYKTASDHLERLNDEVIKLEKADEKAKAKHAKDAAQALKELEGVMTLVYDLRTEIDTKAAEGNIHTKPKLFEMSRTLSQILKSYEPKGK